MKQMFFGLSLSPGWFLVMRVYMKLRHQSDTRGALSLCCKERAMRKPIYELLLFTSKIRAQLFANIDAAV